MSSSAGNIYDQVYRWLEQKEKAGKVGNADVSEAIAALRAKAISTNADYGYVNIRRAVNVDLCFGLASVVWQDIPLLARLRKLIKLTGLVLW